MFKVKRRVAPTLFALLVCADQAAATQLGGCPIFPNDNIWNAAVDTLPVDPKSGTYIQTEGGANVQLHPDFGTVWNGAPNGIPFVVVPASQALVPIVLEPYGGEADPGPYPIPPNAPIEGGANSSGDRHVLVLQQGTCKLYELFSAFPLAGGAWQGFGAVFDLTKNAPLRPNGWTSADAAGLPMMPGLVKYDEVQAAVQGSGVVTHALRFTVPYTRREYVWPARHFASSSTDPNRPPMGLRFRLKASVNIDFYPGTSTPVSPSNKVILRTLKKYGMFLADNGGSFFISGAPDPRWNDDDLNLLKRYRAGDFEAVDSSSLMVDVNSGQARQPTIGGGLQLSAAPSSVAAGGSLTVSWSGIANPGATNWIGLYRPGAAAQDHGGNWMYVSCGKSATLARASGSCSFPIPATLASGTYELRLHAPSSWSMLATSNPITITGSAAAGPQLSAAPSTVTRGGALTVSWSGIANAAPTNWIGLYRPGAASQDHLGNWMYVSCSKTPATARASGTCTFQVPATLGAGSYELRLHYPASWTVLVRSTSITLQ